MPLPIVTNIVVPEPEAPITPNAVYAPAIVLKSNIIDGKLVTSAIVSLKGAKVDENGAWSLATSDTKTIVINDIDNLDADLAHLSTDVQQLFVSVVMLVGQLNNIRQLI